MGKIQESKVWKFKKSGDYYTDLAMKESTNNPTSINELGYIGLYQMGERALVDTGYYRKDRKPGQNLKKLYNHDWTGTWTGKNGIHSREDFLANREVQDIAVREYHKIIWEKYLRNFHLYQDVELGGVKLTKSGMISCSHLVGQGSMIKFIESKGVVNNDDRNHTTCADYLKGFMGYEIDYSTQKRYKDLKESKSFEIPKKQEDVQKEIDIEKITKLLKCLEMHQKLTEEARKFDDIFKQFADKKTEELDQLVKQYNAETISEIEEYRSMLQKQLDATRANLTVEVEAEVNRILNAKELNARLKPPVNFPNSNPYSGGVVIIEAHREQQEMTNKANEKLAALKSSYEDQLEAKGKKLKEEKSELIEKKHAKNIQQLTSYHKHSQNFLMEAKEKIATHCENPNSDFSSLEREVPLLAENFQKLLDSNNMLFDDSLA